MATDTKVTSLVINKLTQAQYNSIEEKKADELYLITDLLPEQTADEAGKVLTTNGTTTAWTTLSADNVTYDADTNTDVKQAIDNKLDKSTNIDSVDLYSTEADALAASQANPTKLCFFPA